MTTASVSATTTDDKSNLIIVTGASRGLGRSVATEFAREISGSNNVLILVARSADGLERTYDQVSATNSKTDVRTMQADLADLDVLDKTIDALLEECTRSGDSTFDRAIFINNAGSLGPVGPGTTTAANVTLDGLRSAIDLNITSSLWLTTRLGRELSRKQMVIVNISSLCALQPFPTMATYCAGKAARDMYHATLAKETDTSLRVLNYAPGALQTDMTDSLINSETLDKGLNKWYQSAHDRGELIPPDKTAKKLVRLVLEDAFECGQHVDYWDVYKEMDATDDEADFLAEKT